MKKVKARAEIVAEAYPGNKDLLSKREQDIITKFFGIGTAVRHSLAELGEEYKVSRERIRQIKNSALKKLKVDLKKHK